MDKIVGNFFLIGLMGAGKTTIGRSLARRLDCEFYDSDHEIECRTGVKISTIFDIEGEQRFREREAEVLADLISKTGIVLATGGGAVLCPQTQLLLRQHGTVIYLRAEVKELYFRTKYDKSRPLLQKENPLQILETLFKERDEIYTRLAHVIVDTSQQSAHQLVQFILDKPLL